MARLAPKRIFEGMERDGESIRSDMRNENWPRCILFWSTWNAYPILSGRYRSSIYVFDRDLLSFHEANVPSILHRSTSICVYFSLCCGTPAFGGRREREILLGRVRETRLYGPPKSPAVWWQLWGGGGGGRGLGVPLFSIGFNHASRRMTVVQSSWFVLYIVLLFFHSFRRRPRQRRRREHTIQGMSLSVFFFKCRLSYMPRSLTAHLGMVVH